MSVTDKKRAFVQGSLDGLARRLATVVTTNDAREFRAMVESTIAFDHQMVGGLVLEPELWQHFSHEIQRLRDAARWQVPEPRTEPSAWTVAFVVGAELNNLDTGESVADTKVLGLANGASPLSELPVELLNNGGGIRVLRANTAIVFDAAERRIRCRIALGLPREPSSAELDALAAALDGVLFTGWGLNLEWRLPEDPLLDDLMLQVNSGFALERVT